MTSTLEARPHVARRQPDSRGVNGPAVALLSGGRSVALVGTYPPTECGLATFTSNLRAAIAEPGTGWRAEVVRVVDGDEIEPAHEVVAHWRSGDRDSLRHAQAVLERADVVLVQHEFGLFGGEDGDEILDLVHGLAVPVVVVLHTVLSEPSTHQRMILDQLLTTAAAVVVQSDAARQRLVRVHGALAHHVEVIPHGAMENFAGPVDIDVPRPAVLTWGLLSPGKGVEHGIAAMARLATGSGGRPVSYVVAGQTHPKVRAAHGERYRDDLRALARSLGVAERVRFDDAYRDWDSLRALVRSVDVVLLPYDSREQVTSGVLAEAVASGKPVVATRFPHAEELLAGGMGLLVSHGDAGEMADAIARVLYEPGLATEMTAAARLAAGPLLWPAVGASYRSLVERIVGARAAA